MRAYSYVAYTETGRRRRGTLTAESEPAATQALAAQGLATAEIAPLSNNQGWQGPQRLSADERCVFTRQMAMLLAAGLPTQAALRSMSEGTANSRVQAVTQTVQAATLDGYALSEAMAHCRGGFPAYSLAAVRAGERTGALPAVFDRLAEYFEAQGEIRSDIATALIYPICVAVIALLVCAGLATQVVPELAALFEAAGAPVPSVTRALMSTTDWLGRYGGALALLLAGAIATTAYGLTRPKGRDWARRAVLRLPLFGHLGRLALAAQYLRTVALVLSSQQTALAAVSSAAQVVAVSTHRAEADAAAKAVSEGEAMASALRRVTFLPPVAVQLLHVGEASGRLAPMAERAALLAETTLNTDRKRATALLDPALMIGVGALVLVIALAVLLPIFDLQTTIGG